MKRKITTTEKNKITLYIFKISAGTLQIALRPHKTKENVGMKHKIVCV